jgi:hypothetical protein
MRNSGSLSVRDRIFGVIAAFSALYCFAVSFALSLPGGRERFFIGLAVFLVSFSFVKYKKGVALGILGFIALRFAWAAIAFFLQHLK